jgi:hypothetical protein
MKRFRKLCDKFVYNSQLILLFFRNFEWFRPVSCFANPLQWPAADFGRAELQKFQLY